MTEPFVVGIHVLTGLRFPGRAGELQEMNNVPAFIRELGENYGTYHDFLRDRLAQLGGRPEPDDFASQGEFFAAWDKIHDVVRGEALLRACRRWRVFGDPLDAALRTDVPLIRNDSLISVE